MRASRPTGEEISPVYLWACRSGTVYWHNRRQSEQRSALVTCIFMAEHEHSRNVRKFNVMLRFLSPPPRFWQNSNKTMQLNYYPEWTWKSILIAKGVLSISLSSVYWGNIDSKRSVCLTAICNFDIFRACRAVDRVTVSDITSPLYKLYRDYIIYLRSPALMWFS
jgi:hypothetical protein